MRATSGVFKSRADAERAAWKQRSIGLREDRITLLVPGQAGKQTNCVPVSAAERPGMGWALGAVMGVAFGLAGGFQLGVVIGVVPAIGPVISVAFLGAAIVGVAGMVVGAMIGSAVDNAMTEGLPEDELFVYEDALRKARSVLLAFPDDAATAESIRKLLTEEGAESIDEARKQWWIGLRSAEQEHYSKRGLVARAKYIKAELVH
jgi:hypothetical protein